MCGTPPGAQLDAKGVGRVFRSQGRAGDGTQEAELPLQEEDPSARGRNRIPPKSSESFFLNFVEKSCNF